MKSDWSDYASCPVCLDLYDETVRAPKSLHCGHTVCKKCITELVAASGDRDDAKLSVQCPECRDSWTYDDVTSVDLLPTNVSLKSLVGLLKKEETGAGDTDTSAASGASKPNGGERGENDGDVLVSCPTCPNFVSVKQQDGASMSAKDFWICVECGGQSYCSNCASEVHGGHRKEIYTEYMKKQFTDVSHRLNELRDHVTETRDLVQNLDNLKEKYTSTLAAMENAKEPMENFIANAERVVGPAKAAVTRFGSIEKNMAVFKSKLEGFKDEDFMVISQSKLAQTLQLTNTLLSKASGSKHDTTELRELMAPANQSWVQKAVTELKLRLQTLEIAQNMAAGAPGESPLPSAPPEVEGEISSSGTGAEDKSSDGIPASVENAQLFRYYAGKIEELATPGSEMRERFVIAVREVMEATGAGFHDSAIAFLRGQFDVVKAIELLTIQEVQRVLA